MKIEGWQCESCGKMKAGTNHWLLLHVESMAFNLFPWDESVANRDGDFYEHLCGAACATKKLSAWLGSQQGQPATVVSDIGNGH